MDSGLNVPPRPTCSYVAKKYQENKTPDDDRAERPTRITL
jgi:hypothetical protein